FRRPISDVDGLFSEDHVLEYTSRRRLKWSSLADEFGESRWDVEFRGRAKRAILIVEHDAELGLADARRLLQHGLEHWLQLAGRTADDLQHLRSRSLLLQRLPQIVGALTQLIEESRVLDCDDGLGSKVLDQLDLLTGEGADLLPIDIDIADQFVVLEHRDDEERASSGALNHRDG